MSDGDAPNPIDKFLIESRTKDLEAMLNLKKVEHEAQNRIYLVEIDKLQARAKELEENLRSSRNKNEDMDHAYGLLQSRVKGLEEAIKLYRGAIVESGVLKKENARLRKVIDETCPRSSECSKMSKVVEAAREWAETMDETEDLVKALRDLDGEKE